MRRLVIGVALASLIGCSTNMGHRDPVEIKQELNVAANEANSRPLVDLPTSVNDDLMPSLDGKDFASTSSLEKRFRVNARNVDARAFFGSLVKGTPFNMVIHPKVSGRISLKLQDVTLDEVLAVVSDIYGYNATRQGNIIKVFPATLRTEVIPVDYLQLQRRGVSLTSITTGSMTNNSQNNSSKSNSSSNSNNKNNSNNNNSSNKKNTTPTGGSSIETLSESDFWTQLEKAVTAMIGSGQGRSIVVSPQASLISVRAYPNELREVKEFLGVSQERLKRQVVLEAKIMEVTLNDGYQQGINWSNITSSIGGTDIIFGRTGVNNAAGVIPLPGGDAIAAALGGQTNITIKDGNFEAVLSFLETQGDLNVLSSPRVTAANNQKAIIKVGGDEYFVTDISGGEVSGDNSQASPDIELTPFFSGISLDVTPQINDEREVLLHVHPAVVDVVTESKEIDLGSQFGVYKLPLAKSSIRESDSVIHARSGDVVVIGGLMKSQTADQVSKVPLLGDIPALGHLFRNVNKITQKTELVILLKPTVVGEQTWQKEIERSRTLVTDWFPEDN
ncbi:MSHA biogenesis protein MshL [Photobacterium jeanii]|uniref:MSHA biogenesis protein MshL n=1 Tax=Photobacterium jeanii TaxID=858640 RepID=A0A178KGS0_9GAMM|nr:pilus (MSHA type) biogenesis protein MshL [Photobacterium jeanii]OAN16509.1 MSHA biogenesis protein MshL [Photobacterium jeanii]PST87902.1 pilus (MSHA type) biogenesis protein MshL [Photobacterium jeanii]